MCGEIAFFASFFPKGVSLVWKWFLIPLGCSSYSTLYLKENCCFIVLRQSPVMKPRLAWNSLCSKFHADFELMAVLLSHLPHESFIHVFVGRRMCIPWHLCGGQSSPFHLYMASRVWIQVTRQAFKTAKPLSGPVLSNLRYSLKQAISSHLLLLFYLDLFLFAYGPFSFQVDFSFPEILLSSYGAWNWQILLSVRS